MAFNAQACFTWCMKRRRFLEGFTLLAANSMVLSRRSFAGHIAMGQDQVLTEAQMKSLLQGWMNAFNASEASAYRAFIAEYLPDGLPYLDDDLAVRDVSGGFELLRSEVTAPNEITGWVKDRSWDRFSRVMLTAKDAGHLSDVGFRGAPAPPDFSIPRLTEHEALQTFEAKLQAEVDAGRFSGAVLVAKRDKVLFQRALGMRDIAEKLPVLLQTRFCIGSMGKMFTAVAVLQLVQHGRVRLTDTIASYLPNYPNAALAKKVTVEQLLTHTGGTGDIFGPKYDGHSDAFHSPDSFIALYGTREAEFEPGSKWYYSNYGYILLGAIIERATGQPFSTYFAEKVFKKAGMRSTSQESSPDGKSAIPYTGAIGTGLKPLPPYHGTSAGGGYSTVEDFFAFAKAIQSNQLLDAKHTSLLTTGKVNNGSYSLGLAVSTRNGVPCYGHGGSAPGVNGDLTIYPESGYITAVLCNRGYPLALNAAGYIGARLPA
jgi:D-alanyl-D-alanine carboxypeptidase